MLVTNMGNMFNFVTMVYTVDSNKFDRNIVVKSSNYQVEYYYYYPPSPSRYFPKTG